MIMIVVVSVDQSINLDANVRCEFMPDDITIDMPMDSMNYCHTDHKVG